MLLNNDLLIKLIGIKTDVSKLDEALRFLNLKLKNQRVFLKYDSLKYDKENNLLVYLYLKNKTFINAHLIKNRLAQVDSSLNFKYKDKFLAMQR